MFKMHIERCADICFSVVRLIRILFTAALAFVIALATRSIRNGDKMSGPLSA
jgi:hypothetical protein